MVTHDRTAAAAGDRVVNLRDGRLEGDRSTGDTHDPADAAPGET